MHASFDTDDDGPHLVSRPTSLYPLSPFYELCIRAIRGNVARRGGGSITWPQNIRPLERTDRASLDLAQRPQVYEPACWAHPRGYALRIASRKVSLFTMPTR